MKQKHYIAGLYYRLSQEDERQGESVSIDNQRAILRKSILLPFCDISSMISINNDKAYGYNNSYALLMPVPALLPIVSIKIGYNGRAKQRGNKEIYSESIARG